MTAKRERRNEFDLIRAVSALWIVLFHYSYSFIQYGVGGDHIYVMMYANGAWGGVFVSLFFMLSGGSLYYNWQDRLGSFAGRGGVLDFFKKRWLAIFPTFYIAWFVCYMINVISFGWLWNWGGSYKKLILTFLGVDGYFMYREMNYYTVGEWFLGAIIILYLIYPLLQWCMNKIPVIATIIITALFALNVARREIPFMSPYNAWVIISDNINLITCLMSFWIGMLLIKGGRRLINKASFIIACVLFLILLIIPIPVSLLITIPLMAACWYFILSFISIWLDSHRDKWKLTVYDRIVGFFSKYSFSIFLVHHVVVQKMMSLFAGREMSFGFSVLYFLLNIVIISILAVILTKTADFTVGLFKTLKAPVQNADS